MMPGPTLGRTSVASPSAPSGSDWEDGGAAAAIVRGEHELSGRMHADMRRRGAGRTHRTDALELQTVIVNGVGDDGAAVRALVVVDLADGIQPGLCRIHGQPGRIANIIDDLQLRQRGGRRIEAKQINAAAIRRVGADVGVVIGLRRRGGRHAARVHQAGPSRRHEQRRCPQQIAPGNSRSQQRLPHGARFSSVIQEERNASRGKSKGRRRILPDCRHPCRQRGAV